MSTEATTQDVTLLTAAGVGIAGLTALPVWHERPGDGLRVELRVEARGDRALIAQAVLRNEGTEPARVARIRWSAPQLRGAGPSLRFPAALEPRVFHTENFRGDYFGVGTARGTSYLTPLPNVTTEYGWSEDHVFPGLFVAAGTQPLGLLVAAASQETFHLIFRLRGADRAKACAFEIDELPTGQAALTIAPGAELAGERIYFALVPTSDPQAATEDYYDRLAGAGLFERIDHHNPLPQQRIWCSWNYDFFADITEADVLAQLPLLREKVPAVGFVQIDDGYQWLYGGQQRAMIDLVYETPQPHDSAKFPSGLPALAAKIREAGLRPAIWLGLWAASGSKLVADHPDWTLLDELGEPYKFTGWYGGTHVLDPSVPGVRAYLDEAFRIVFREWGFEGLKLDFSSFAFESKRVRYREPGWTALQCRRWFADTVRKWLPDDGFFGWCVVAGTGDPFLAPQADYFRCAEDIGHGNWELAKRIASWCANTNLLLNRWPVLPNIDSIGWSEAFDETCWESWLNLCAISGMAVEISGDLTKLPVARLERLARTLELSDPRRRLRIVDVPSGPMTLPPAVWAAGELLAVFNWADEAASVTVPADLRGAYLDAWSGGAVKAGGSFALAAHESRLLRRV